MIPVRMIAERFSFVAAIVEREEAQTKAIRSYFGEREAPDGPPLIGDVRKLKISLAGDLPSWAMEEGTRLLALQAFYYGKGGVLIAVSQWHEGHRLTPVQGTLFQHYEEIKFVVMRVIKYNHIFVYEVED